MTRNRRGWLTAESLIAGEREQYAVQRRYGRVTIELRHDPNEPRDAVGRQQWKVTLTIAGKDELTPSGTVEYRAYRLDAARNKFKQLQKQHP